MIRLIQNRYIILLINLIIIGFLLLIWTSDKLINYYSGSFFFEGFKLLGLSIIAVLGFLFINGLTRLKLFFNSEIKSRLVYSILIVLIVFGYKYVQYTNNIIKISDSKRYELEAKIKRTKELNGTSGLGLTYNEYLIIKEYIKLPKISDSAYDINYTNSYDGFLPDYMITMDYKLPMQTQIKNIKFEQDDFSRYQHIDTFQNYKKVIYEEILR